MLFFNSTVIFIRFDGDFCPSVLSVAMMRFESTCITQRVEYCFLYFWLNWPKIKNLKYKNRINCCFGKFSCINSQVILFVHKLLWWKYQKYYEPIIDLVPKLQFRNNWVFFRSHIFNFFKYEDNFSVASL